MLALIAVVAHALGLVSSIDAVMTTRTSQGAIAWAVCLNTFPYLAVPAYWVLGRNKRRKANPQRDQLLLSQGDGAIGVPPEVERRAGRAHAAGRV